MALKGILLDKKTERGIIYAALIALIIAGVIFKLSTRVTAYEFMANLKEVKIDSLIGEGVFIGSKGENLSGGKELELIEIFVRSETKITRESFVVPKTKEMFKVDDLEKDVKEVDFDTLKKDFQEITHSISLQVKTENNIFGKKEFQAKEIKYRLPIFP